MVGGEGTVKQESGRSGNMEMRRLYSQGGKTCRNTFSAYLMRIPLLEHLYAVRARPEHCMLYNLECLHRCLNTLGIMEPNFDSVGRVTEFLPGQD